MIKAQERVVLTRPLPREHPESGDVGTVLDRLPRWKTAHRRRGCSRSLGTAFLEVQTAVEPSKRHTLEIRDRTTTNRTIPVRHLVATLKGGTMRLNPNPTTNPEHWKLVFFYFDRADPRLFVRGRVGLAPFTVNFGRPAVLAITAVILALVVILSVHNN